MKKRAISMILCILTLLPLAAGCGGTGTAEQTAALTETPDTGAAQTAEPPTEAQTEPQPEPPSIPTVTMTVATDGATSLKIKTAQNADLAGNAVGSLMYQLKTEMGFGVTRGIDVTKPGAAVNEGTKEFIVGHTNRTDENEFREKVIAAGEHAFGIHMTETKVIFTASKPDYVPQAVEYFITHYLKVCDLAQLDYERGVRLSVTGPVDTIVTGEICDLSDIEKDHLYGTLSEKVGKIPKTGNFKILQGGCVYGKYAWFAMINTADYDTNAAGVYIYKLDSTKYRVLKRSEILMLDHANDITYIPATNEIAVAHCYVDNKKITLLDADTLQVTRVLKAKDKGFYSIDYNETANEFIGGFGKSNMLHFSDTMTLKTTFNNGFSTQLTTQGICSDENYIYHVLFTSASVPAEPYNMIFVNKYKNGVGINRVILSIAGQEPENISDMGDHFIIGCNSSDSANADVYSTRLVDFGVK